VNSNKGGLGTTVFSALLAAKMKKMGYKTALLETSFSSVLPYYFGFSSANGLELISNGIVPPVSSFDYPYLSPSLFMINDPHVVDWDKESILRFFKKMIINTNWGDTDILIIDVSAEHTGFIKDIKAFLPEKLHHAILMVDYKQASSDYTKAYIDYFNGFMSVLYVLLSPSKIDAKEKEKEKPETYGIKHNLNMLPFLETAYSPDIKPNDIIKNINGLYAPILEEVSTACLSIF
ncbi:MAG: P-loop NTPase, partial [Proteobacteria bacterium]|nr:P-loop NTPase [Pseudomonadota bacterium]